MSPNVHLYNREALTPLLDTSAERHRHLCPRQVLGIRMGLFGLRQLGLLDAFNYLFDNEKKRLLTIMETDGCGADGVAVATDCHVGRRTLRIVDYGKMAATFVDTKTEKAIRVAPSAQSRETAPDFAPGAPSRWHAYLEAYQVMPDELLLEWQPVQLTPSISEILSRAGVRATCADCGEEIINEREVLVNGRTLCRSCAGNAYYLPLQEKIRPAAIYADFGWPQFNRKGEIEVG
ncbi:MAG: TraR/DksA C4-type zinc finger protein [Ardenticatenaceae bacterium]|nr:TraR/DksA C4-type zinc finger protein [Ardenticatenaceae bacterium]MCB9443469.1 TraR/DksA C4-type zinc finger protein [Ardenticatenaceae bacterium]